MKLRPFARDRLRFASILVSLASLAAIWYFARFDREPSVDSGAALFPRDFDPPLSSKTEMEIAALEESIRQNPPNAAAATRLGQAYLQKARATIDPMYLNRAEALFKRALELDSHDFQAIVGLGRSVFRDMNFAMPSPGANAALRSIPGRVNCTESSATLTSS